MKKEAKTFVRSGTRWVGGAHLKWQKFFGSFFQKRTASFTDNTDDDAGTGSDDDTGDDGSDDDGDGNDGTRAADVPKRRTRPPS